MNATTLLLPAAALVASAACATVPAPPRPAPAPYEQKLAAIVRFEDARILRDPHAAAPEPAVAARRGGRPIVEPPEEIESLGSLLVDSEGRVRRRAALAIGRVGLRDGVDPLVRTLADPDPDVRAMAAFALGLIGDRAAADPLIEAIGDRDPRVQGRAAEALGAIGVTEAAPAIGTLVASKMATGALDAVDVDELSYPLSGDVEAFRLAVYALVRLKAWDALAPAVLAPDGHPRVSWWPVAYAVQRLGDPRGFEALAAFARGRGTEAVAFAARGLGELKDARGVGLLVPLLDPAARDGRVVAAAIRALGRIGDASAVPALLRLLATPRLDASLRLEVVTALGGMRDVRATDALIDLLGDRWDVMRAEALAALAAIDAPAFVTVLSTLDPDPSWVVRARLATVLAALDEEIAGPTLMTMLDDRDDRVIPRVLEGLAATKAPELGRVLVEHLRAHDPVVRSTAATLLGDVSIPDADDRLAGAYNAAKADAAPGARLAALAALARHGGDVAVRALRDALADPDWAVRRRAAELLLAIDPSADVSSIRPAPTRAPVDYADARITRPSYAPQAYLETGAGTIQIDLAILDAPLTVRHFIALAGQGFFDGSTFHRVVPNFVVQDGDPRGDGEGGPGYTIRDEINTRPYLRGTVGMALAGADTGGSQFFITHGPQPHLDGRYTVFGRVVSGMEVVDRLARGDRIDRVWVWDGIERIEGPVTGR